MTSAIQTQINFANKRIKQEKQTLKNLCNNLSKELDENNLNGISTWRSCFVNALSMIEIWEFNKQQLQALRRLAKK